LCDIITDENNKTFASKAVKIVSKYIQNGSEYECNLSYQTKKYIKKYFNKRKFLKISLRFNKRNSVLTRTISDVKNTEYKHEYNVSKTATDYKFSDDDIKVTSPIMKSKTCHTPLTRLRRSHSFCGIYDTKSVNNNIKGPKNKYFSHQNVYAFDVDDIKFDFDNKILSETKSDKIIKNIKDDLELLNIFDKALEEVYSIMRKDCMLRFLESDHFKQFWCKYGNKIKNGNIGRKTYIDLNLIDDDPLNNMYKDKNCIMIKYYCDDFDCKICSN